MKNLRDALLKAGVVSEKQKRQAEHARRQEEKAKQKQGGGELAVAEAGPPQADRASRPAPPESSGQADQTLEQGSGASPIASAAGAQAIQHKALIELVQGGRLDQESGGRRRFYFLARDGSIPFLAVSESLGIKLERGHAAIVENPAKIGDHTVISREAAMRLQATAPDLVRFFRA